ncbi:DUF3726 domain-containing protein [Poseidonibacter lekithochrous]|uniref:DUF3726 domain-containing protein n=1 Tax=Poseidonibacter lekithochrous TaxID=1904463 RepID=UPI0008FC848A|nr:DUF3726 domain-containing protein [Poseidonibacter lekithochrous]QKJ21642.1 DUF3726 domain-containing protein [Poseidonibacter lekithochrous]
MSKNINTIENSQLRDSSVVMDLKRMGAMHQSRISFTRTLIRKMANENWTVTKSKWDLCKDGYGTAIYELKTPNNTYNVVIFSNHIEDDERNDRVIAEKWDTTFTLIDGDVSDTLLDALRNNVPLQEAGRNSNRALVLARANKSVRVFSHVIDSLAKGEQPSIEEVSKVGYILRTTAVYGSGKFGINDYAALGKNPDFSQSFSAEMCAVYILRQFSLDWANFIAKNKGGDKAVSLDKDIQRFLGVGNATGLGMAPYLIRHPKVVDNWLYQRELALSKVSLEEITKEKSKELIAYLNRAITHLEDVVTINEHQKELNVKAALEIPSIIESTNELLGKTYKELIQSTTSLSFEAQEVLISSIIELYPQLVDCHESEMRVDEQPLELSGVTIEALKAKIQSHYSWALKYDFSKEKSNYWFWYVSEDKGEPRLGIRNVDKGAELELPLDIARQVSKLNKILVDISNEEAVTKFLLENPQYSSIIRRIWTMGACKMGEIQANVIDEEFLPMDLLRAKLAMFGATKFDPRSDRWVQVTFFQSAPLVDEVHNGEWLFPQIPKSKDDRLNVESGKISVSRTELATMCNNAFNGLKRDSGEADLISKMVVDLEMVGLNGVKHFANALKYLKNSNNLSLNISSEGSHITADLNNDTILGHIQILVAYALESVPNYETVTLEIKNCHNRWLVFSQALRIAKKGLNARFSWNNSSDNGKISYCINANDDLPTVCNSTTDSSDVRSLTIEISKNKIESTCDSAEVISSQTLQKSFNNAVENGLVINLNDWNDLKEVAKAIYVASSETSRNDAGGVVEK